MKTARDRIIDAKLQAMGMRRAGSHERGWVVMLQVGGQTVSVWATDERPKET